MNLGAGIYVNTSVHQGQKVLFKGEGISMNQGREGYGSFSSEGRCNVYGNIMSMLYGDEYEDKDYFPQGDYSLAFLFSRMTNLISAENLILPATNLASNCYYRLFQNCIALEKAPKLLPAVTLSNSCYQQMFGGCTSLVEAPELPATTLAQGCYSNMFENCVSLVNAPELPATNLATQCYSSMFKGCTSLSYIKCLATDLSAYNCTTIWVSNVSQNGTFVKSSGVNWGTGENGIPSGWTVEEV